MMLSVKSIPCVLVACALFAQPCCGLVVDPKWQNTSTVAKQDSSWPLLVPLQRESVPVIRNNVTVSYKTSYSGLMSIGKPAQEFRVVFDTGSAHVVVPASSCTNETCLEHRRYHPPSSSSASLINVDGSPVPEDELCDQVTIGYGTGMITGEFVHEQVCPGNATGDACVDVSIVMAVDMTTLPFKSFNFDGIFGLALGGLALSPQFSFLHNLAASKPSTPSFGVFLTDGEDGQESEIALGGHNPDRILTPLQWAPVALAKHGYWQVAIKEVRIGGKTLDICKDGTCRGIVDTGTSHLGVPGDHLNEFMTKLAIDTDRPPSDCREVVGEELEFILEGGIELALHPEHYMRPLALAHDLEPAPSQPLDWLQTKPRNEMHSCAPRLMPVNLPDPLGPNLFILGEPVLHRYYTVYDWKEEKIGFSISSSNANKRAMKDGRNPTDESITVFMQVTLRVTLRGKKAPNLLALAM